MTVQELANELNALITNGKGSLDLKGLMQNGVEAHPNELKLINGDQDLIPAQAAEPSYVLLKFPQI